MLEPSPKISSKTAASICFQSICGSTASYKVLAVINNFYKMVSDAEMGNRTSTDIFTTVCRVFDEIHDGIKRVIHQSFRQNCADLPFIEQWDENLERSRFCIFTRRWNHFILGVEVRFYDESGVQQSNLQGRTEQLERIVLYVGNLIFCFLIRTQKPGIEPPVQWKVPT